MAQFEIRRALPQDMQRITEIYNSNTEFLLHHLGRERVDRHFIAREMEEMRRVGFLSYVLVERESGRCVGVLDYRPGACVYLSLLMLDAALRGKGFGTACYGCLEETVRRQGASSVRIDVVEGYPGSAAPFWEKQGFVRTGRAKLAWDGCSAEAAVMLKQLACAGGQHAPSSVRC